MTKRMRIIAGKMAIYDYTGSDTPLTDPANHLTELHFHSDFDYYAAASGYPVDVTISHASVAADTGTDVSGGAGLVISYNSIVETDYELSTHGLGYVPNFMVSVDGVQYPAGCPIQTGSSGARRCITFWADTTKLYVRDSARPSVPGLPAISITYHVAIYRSAAAVAGAPNYQATPTRVRFGFGRIDSNETTLREAAAGETTYALPAGETMNIANGRPRFALPDGSVFDIGPLMGPSSYNGSFFGGPSKLVTL